MAIQTPAHFGSTQEYSKYGRVYILLTPGVGIAAVGIVVVGIAAVGIAAVGIMTCTR
jgi:hypothetical protein